MAGINYRALLMIIIDRNQWVKLAHYLGIGAIVDTRKKHKQPTEKSIMSYILKNLTNDAYFSSSDKRGIGPLVVEIKAKKNEELLTYADEEVAFKFHKLFEAKCFMYDFAEKANPKKHYQMIYLYTGLPYLEIENGVCYRFVDGVRSV